jgi:hypothetical protein
MSIFKSSKGLMLALLLGISGAAIAPAAERASGQDAEGFRPAVIAEIPDENYVPPGSYGCFGSYDNAKNFYFTQLPKFMQSGADWKIEYKPRGPRGTGWYLCNYPK